MENKIRTLTLITILTFISFSLVFADIDTISLDDVRDHEKIVHKLNRIIEKLNQDRKADRADAKELKKYLKYQLGVNDKITKKMIQKGWVGTHSEVEP